MPTKQSVIMHSVLAGGFIPLCIFNLANKHWLAAVACVVCIVLNSSCIKDSLKEN